jgi:GAF domain-containing protein
MQKKAIGFVELPDEALDLFGHYAQRPNWVVGIVVSVDPQTYAVRMAQLLHIPVLEQPNRLALMGCQRLIVGSKPASLIQTVRDFLADTETEVIPVEEALTELKRRSQESAGSTPLTVVDSDTPAASGESPETVVHLDEPPEKSRIEITRDAPLPARRAEMREAEATRAPGSFDPAPLLGVEFREKLGALPMDLSGDQLLNEILRMAVDASKADSGSIMLVDETEHHLRIAVADGLPQWVVTHARQKVGEGVAGEVFATGLPRHMRGQLPITEGGSADVRPGLREAVSVPIPGKDGPIGVLNINVESERPPLPEQTVALLTMLAREASGAVLKAIDLKRFTGQAQREAILKQVERLMGLQEDLPSRLHSVGDALAQTLGADYAHCFLVDTEGKQLYLLGHPPDRSGTGVHRQPLDRGFLGWVLHHGTPHVLEAADNVSSERVAMIYLPIVSERPYAVLVLEKATLGSGSALDILKLLTEAQEIAEAIIALEEASELRHSEISERPDAA